MEYMEIEVASWVKEMLQAGNDTFYKAENGTELQFSPVSKEYEKLGSTPDRWFYDTTATRGTTQDVL